MQAITTSPFNLTMLRRANTWYTIKDGNWSDPAVWLSNGKRKYNSPQPGDTVYVDHNVAVDVSATVYNLYVAGKLTCSINSLIYSIIGDLQVSGNIDFTGSNINLALYGYNNFITSFEAGNSTIIYTRAGDQNVLNLAYKNLSIFGLGKKYMVSNLTLTGNLIINAFSADNAFMECEAFDLTVNGTTSIQTGTGISGGNFGKSGAGNLIFGGALTIDSNIVFSSNITGIEFRNGGTLSGFGGSVNINCPVTFSTNNQTITGNSINFNSTVTISGPIALTNTNSSIYFYDVVNGDNVSSTLNNNGFMNLGVSITPMTTGIFNYKNTSTSTISYIFNGDFTLPYTSYAGLNIMGSGTKTLSGNTTIGSNLSVNNFDSGKSKLDCSVYNLTINGTTIINGAGGTNDSKLLATSGTIVFAGACTINSNNLSYTAGPTLEFRNGATLNPFGGSATISCAVNFTTNNQTITTQGSMQFAGDITLSGGISLSNATISTGLVVTGLVNGSSGSDTFLNSGYMNYQNATAPMVTGKLYCNQSSNTWVYGLSADQDIQSPSDPTPGYKNLTLAGSGAKRLLGNVSVKGTYNLTSPATLNSNGFALTNP